MVNEPHIGTLGERSLHAALKEYYAKPGDELEVRIEGYVIDIVRDDKLIEIQTGNFASLKRKLRKLTDSYHVHLIHPIAADKWIVKYGPNQKTLLDRRLSPQHKDIMSIFYELVSFPHLVRSDNFSLGIALVQIEEVRVNDGKGSWRRGGWSIVDSQLLEVVDTVTFNSVEDFRQLLPEDFPNPFTTRDIAREFGVRINLAGKMAYCLRKMGAIEHIGKRGNAYIYKW